MNRTLIIIISVILIICAILLSMFYTNKQKYNEIKKFNMRYEYYLNKEIIGTNIATIINQAVDDNEKAMIKKNEKNKYIQNDINSVYIEIKITEFAEDQIYTMETLYNGGINEFVKYYGQIKFKCGNIDYNSKGQVKYLLFEQVK